VNAVRALIVGPVGTDASAELVRSLVSCHDLVVAVDAGAEICRQASVACDVVVGDMDSISPAELERLERSGVRLDCHPAD
jgi:thiamine pyrophosphokinase